MSLLEPLEQPIFSIGDWFCEFAGESPLSGVFDTANCRAENQADCEGEQCVFHHYVSFGEGNADREASLHTQRSKKKQMRGGLIEIGTIGVSG